MARKNKILNILLSLAAFLVFVIGGNSCKKDKLLTSGGELRFSVDTLTFDTVFTNQGSFTCSLKIYNPQSQPVTISSVRLEKGNTSFFKLNVDGISGNEVKDIDVAANDSVFVFATVKIDPTSANSPFFIEDKLIATLNGGDFSIPVIAYGQNAHYFVGNAVTNGYDPYIFDKDSTLAIDKPNVFIHGVWVKEGVTLTIPAGCRVYMHQDSRFFVEGTLLVNGSLHDSVVFQGDRLDRGYFGYEGYPGEWGGLYFSSNSTGNKLTYAILKNGGNTALGTLPALIQVSPDSVADLVPQLTIDRSIIFNSIGYGVLGFSADIAITNSLIHTCNAQNLALVRGGKYKVDNTTVANYGSDKVTHSENSTCILLNYFKNGNVLEYYPLNATITNSIFYGTLENELIIDSIDKAACRVQLFHCAVKGSKSAFRPWVEMDGGMLFDVNPEFDSTETEKWNFHLKNTSALIDKGLPNAAITTDLDGVLRPKNIIDIGCYEQ